MSGGGASEKGRGRGQGKGVWVCAIRQLATLVGMKPRSFSTKPTGSTILPEGVTVKQAVIMAGASY